MDNTNSTSKTELVINQDSGEEKQTAALESFPAWQESRKLVNIMKNLSVKYDTEADRLMLKNTPAFMCENIFFMASDAFEKINCNRLYNGAETCLAEISRFRTAIYMLFDRSRISKEDFTSLLVQASRVRKEFALLKQDAVKKKAAPKTAADARTGQTELFETKKRKKKGDD